MYVCCLYSVDEDLDMVAPAFDTVLVPVMTLEAFSGPVSERFDGIVLLGIRLCVISIRRDEPSAAPLIIESTRPFSVGRVDFRLITEHPVLGLVAAEHKSGIAFALRHDYFHFEDEVRIFLYS